MYVNGYYLKLIFLRPIFLWVASTQHGQKVGTGGLARMTLADTRVQDDNKREPRRIDYTKREKVLKLVVIVSFSSRLILPTSTSNGIQSYFSKPFFLIYVNRS